MSRAHFLGRLRGSSAPVEPVIMPPIGRVRNAVREPRPLGWEQVESEIRLEPGLDPAMLLGLDSYSHVIVTFWLDRLSEDRPRPAQLRPGGEATPIQGVLATRSQLRPNPLGVSVVPLLEVHGAWLRVRGLDAIDGTPVLDLKPYIPSYDSVPDARVPAWVLSGDG